MNPDVAFLAILISAVSLAKLADIFGCWLIQHYRAHRRQHSVGNHTNQ